MNERPISRSTSLPKYQKMAMVMTVQMRRRSLTSGHVTSRQIWPLATSSGISASFARRRSPLMRPDEHADDAERATTSMVVVTSTVPIRNHGSSAPRRPGNESEKRLAARRCGSADRRILDTISMVNRPPTGTIPDAPGSYQFKDARAG